MTRFTLHDMRIIAVDPGYGRIGIAILERANGKESVVFSECFATSSKDPHALRLSELKKRVGELCERFKPENLVIEKLFFSKNRKTALSVAEARGVIIGEASSRELSVFEYSPSEVKIAITGYGNSDKRQVQEMVERIAPLAKKNALDDEYDAVAIGLTHFAIRKNPRTHLKINPYD